MIPMIAKRNKKQYSEKIATVKVGKFLPAVKLSEWESLIMIDISKILQI